MRPAPLTGHRHACRLLCVALLLATGLALPGQAAPARRLTLERLYTLPSLIGTRPESPAWSPDSRHLAFLWNDEGMPFLDVWTVDLPDGVPHRLTRMPHPAQPADPGTDIAKLEAEARFETDHGVGMVAYAADSRQILFLLHGALFSLLPGQQPRQLAPALGRIDGFVPGPVGAAAAVMAGNGSLLAVDADTGRTTPVYTPAQEGVAVEEAHWSPDGRQLAFVETDTRGEPTRGIPDYLPDETVLRPVKRPFPGEPSELRRLGIVRADGTGLRWAPLPGQPQDLLFGVNWSPDGRALLVDRSDLYIKHRRLLQVDAASGASTVLVAEDDPQNVTAEWWSAWAPGGHGIYYTSDQPPATDYAVWYKPLGAAAAQPVLRGDFAVFDAALTPAGLFATVNAVHPEQRQVQRLSPDGTAVPVTSAPGTHTVTPSPDGRFLADIFSSDTTPPDLYLQPVGTTPARQLTHSPLPEFQDYRWVAAKYVTFPNVHDGTVIHARLTVPPGGGPRPAILGSVYSNTARNQWGGRIFHPTWGLDQYLVQQGYVLLNPDIRGSSGYGRTFRQRLALDYGGIDVDDLYSGARYLQAAGLADPARIGIWGSSYGGLLTATALFTHPETFRAGVAGAPATSLFHALTGEMRTMMDPQTHPAEYARASAFLKSGGLQGHLMLLHGMRDEVVLFKDSVTLTERLILQGRDVTLTPLPDAPHGWDTEGLAQTRYAYRQLTRFFDTWLLPAQQASAVHSH